MSGIIYKLTNTVNNKIYIGQTTEQRESKRLYEHKIGIDGCRYLNYAIKKYGWDSFKYDRIDTVDEKELNDKETYYISLYDSTNHDIGYNICLGGSGSKGHKLTGDSYLRASNTMFKKGQIPWNKGVSITEEQRDKNRTKAHKKRVIQLDINDNIINIFDSLTAAANAVNGNKTNISAYCRGKYNGKLVYGYKWRFDNL